MKDISIDKKYDIAISYNHSKANSLYGGTNEFVLEHVRADKKYAFIHGDLLLANLDSKYSHKIYKKFDKVVCVSKSCKKIFDETWNDLRSKSVVVYNGVNVRRILMEAGEGFAVNKEVINFITAARLDKVKAIKRTIQAFKYVKDRGLINFKWYIVGNGKELDEDIRYSKELGVDDWIVFLGEKKNPFYYMKNMDALLVLSYQEAAPMVFYEANVLGIPIVSTNTRSAKELVEEKGNGIVCENNLASIVDTLTRLVKNPDILRRIRRNVVKKVDNRESTDSFYRLLDTAYSDDAT
jgi:glycosyltransferase involved in cell wall biosynthesis